VASKIRGCRATNLVPRRHQTSPRVDRQEYPHRRRQEAANVKGVITDQSVRGLVRGPSPENIVTIALSFLEV